VLTATSFHPRQPLSSQPGKKTIREITDFPEGFAGRSGSEGIGPEGARRAAALQREPYQQIETGRTPASARFVHLLAVVMGVDPAQFFTPPAVDGAR
jgi:hypothetical protein